MINAHKAPSIGPVDVLARTLWGEARGEGELGMHAVANVVINRVAKPRWWGRDVAAVCLYPFQFSCWDDGDPNLPKLRSVTSGDKQFMTALRIAADAVNGKLPDITKGATSYKTAALPWPHSWGTERPPLIAIGSQEFYDLDAPRVAP